MEANILIVDDTHENLRLLNKILSERGYVVRPVSNGLRALSSIQIKKPDLVLLDVMMPEMDGYEVCRRLKADESTRDIPVLFISALAEMSDKLKGFSVGGVDYIIKPFQPEEVLVRVKTHLAVHEAQQRLQQQNVRLQQEIDDRRRTERALQQANKELSLLNRVGQMFSSSLDLDAVLKSTLEEVQRLLNVVSTSVWLRLPESGELECREIIGPGSEQLANVRLSAGEGLTGWVAESGENLICADIQADPRHYEDGSRNPDGFTEHSMLSVPLKVKGEVIGVLNLVDPEVDRFTKDDLRFIEPIAANAAIAIENARLYSAAQEANASKDKFLSIISHDLRSPFNSLLGFTQFLYEHFDAYSEEELKNNLQRLHRIAERSYDLLENLLTWARLQRGGMEYKPTSFDLYELTTDILGLFHSEASRKGIVLSTSISFGMKVYADYDMSHTVLRNLMSNALKFTASGGSITLSAQAFEGHSEVAVADSGSGIPPEALDKLFRIDVQYTKPGTDGESGTGLGLILCHDLVQKNGGKLWGESEVGTGSTFRFTIPNTDTRAMKSGKEEGDRDDV